MTTETNAERFKRIKEKVLNDDGPNSLDFWGFVHEDMKFLIHHVERTGELEIDLKISDAFKKHALDQLFEADKEIARLRGCFEDLRNRVMNVSPDREANGSIIEDAEDRFLYEFCTRALAGESNA